MSAVEPHQPLWRRPRPADETLAHQEEHARRRHLLLDPRAPWDTETDVLRPMYRTGPIFWLLFLILGGGTAMLFGTWLYQMINGIGVENINRPVEWALYITNFVFFIGIGHAGTFISAALRVLNIEWRRPISRAAETVTVFGLATAALFPLIHLGRPWKFYWLIPYPNNRGLWPSFHSPIIWDFMAINTYLLGSVMFMYLGLLPDLAMARDRTAGWRNKLYTALALGWRGTEREWAHLETALNIFSYVIIPVMFSVHTIVSWDFAMTLQTGWHSTIFGPYFIVGALYSGVAAVILALTIIRKGMHLEYFLREEHFNGLAKMLLILTFSWAYFYFAEYITTWYGRLPLEKVLQDLFAYGRAAPFWYAMLILNVLIPAVLLSVRRLRTSPLVLTVVCVGILIGMYLERLLIIAIGLGRNELPFSWGIYIPRLPEVLITIGAFCLVGFGYLLFSRVFPLIPVWEVQEGQLLQGLRRIGRALVPTRADPGE